MNNKTYETVQVDLGDRAYPIHVGSGLIAGAGPFIAPLLNQPRTIIVTDKNIAAHWLEPLQTSLQDAGVESQALVLEPGEQTKSFGQLENLCDELLSAHIERATTIIALGGGVIGDLTGFASAITLRGIDFIQIPTTLLAQVDSSVGGKTGINTRHGKNLVGAFHQPKLVLADIGALGTLPARELRAGYAEIVKYGLINDPAFFGWLEENGPRVLAGEPDALRHAVMSSCQAKANIVSSDEREKGCRALLNFGHTFGHSFEAECGYSSTLLHGEAVAIGSVMALAMSERLGHCAPGCAARLREHFKATGLPHDLSGVAQPSWSAEKLLDHMRLDKKVENSRMTFILARAIGDAFITNDIADEDVLAVLRETLVP